MRVPVTLVLLITARSGMMVLEIGTDFDMTTTGSGVFCEFFYCPFSNYSKLPAPWHISLYGSLGAIAQCPQRPSLF